MTPPQDFIIPPLPNLLFTRDSSVWLRDGVAVTALAMDARSRETSMTAAIYRHHPRFAGTPLLYGGDTEHSAWLEGGDVLVLAPGVLAIGVGQRTTPAGVETFADRLFAAGEAHAVLAVPIAQDRATMHLDTVCTMVDRDAVVMYPAIADSLEAYVVTADRVTGRGAVPARCRRRDGDPRAAADRHRPGPGDGRARAVGRRQQHSGFGAGGRRGLRAQHETNARLEAEGIEVMPIAGSELGTGRGGPRCMSCPITRRSG